MEECPSCGGVMDERRARNITLTLTGTEGGADEEAHMDDGDADLLSWICEDCGYKEEAKYRGDEDGDQDDDENS